MNFCDRFNQRSMRLTLPFINLIQPIHSYEIITIILDNEKTMHRKKHTNYYWNLKRKSRRFLKDDAFRENEWNLWEKKNLVFYKKMHWHWWSMNAEYCANVMFLISPKCSFFGIGFAHKKSVDFESFDATISFFASSMMV